MIKVVRIGKYQDRIELVLALVITGLACCAGFSNLLFAPNDLYPLTSDAMGHLAKVRFLAESWVQGEFPTWFPNWYNGSTVVQYYPPLSYWLMVPIFIITQNAMLVFKTYCFIMLFSGGMGVWFFCRQYIGRWCGLFGIVTFCWQPYILLTFFAAGLVAQGPIIALTPWYLSALFAYLKRPTATLFLWCIVLCSLMILSHPMTIFMICVCLMTVFFVLLILKKIPARDYLMMGISIIFAGILTAFWSLVGVTEFENPGIPYLLGEAVRLYTANPNWFLTSSSNFFYFSIPVSLSSMAALVLYTYYRSKRSLKENERFYILFCFLLTVVTIIFSFGLYLPFFKYLPMAESLVPGRILGLTSVSSAILSAYLIHGIQSLADTKGIIRKAVTSVTCLSIMILMLVNMNPFKADYAIITKSKFDEIISSLDLKSGNFEKGRYSTIGAYDSSETYFPLLYNFNICEGWNIEGTPHNTALWNQSIAHSSDHPDSIAKDLAFWNVRSIFLADKFEKVIEELNVKIDFVAKAKWDGNNFYTSETPSSYFLRDQRNALILGVGANAVPIEFPYLIKGKSNRLSDYSLAELKRYKLVYLCEPTVETIQEKNHIEAIATELVNNGISVLIEPTATKSFSLFNVSAADVVLEQSPTLERQNQSSLKGKIDIIQLDNTFGFARVLFGLDEEYYTLIQNDGRLKNSIIGTKNVGMGQVIFLGMHLSQFLKPVYARNWGVPPNNVYPELSADVTKLFEDLFQAYGVNNSFWPEPFPVQHAKWNYQGVDFEYSGQDVQEMTISVTYTPRWKATLDGKPLKVGQKENLVTLELPPGDHQISLRYGMTIYGVIGYTITGLGMGLLFFFFKYYDIISYNLTRLCNYFGRFLQI